MAVPILIVDDDPVQRRLLEGAVTRFGHGAILADGVHGLLAPPDDDAAVAAAIVRLLEEPGLAPKLAEAGFRSTDALAWDAVRGRWLSAYARLARPAATPAAEPRRA